MDKNRCGLCEGRIVNGRCQDCGMNYRKMDGRLYLNERRPDEGHVILNEDRTQGKDSIQLNQTRVQPRPGTEYRQEKPNGNIRSAASKNTGETSGRRTSVWENWNMNGSKKIQLVICAIVIVVSLGAAIFMENSDSGYSETTPELSDESVYGYDNVYEYDSDDAPDFWDGEDWTGENDAPQRDIYEEVKRPLSVTGEKFETTLTAGQYVVGKQIPEGTYRASGDTPNADYMSLSDSENFIYTTWFFPDYKTAEGTYEIEDIRLYEGAVLTVVGQANVTVASENAQTDNIPEPKANPLKDEVTVSLAEQTAGKDFAAGTYDAYILSGSGNLVVLDAEGHITSSCYLEYDTIYNTESFKNIELDKGSRIYIEQYGLTQDEQECEIVLRPSGEVYS
jgi:hypothetical protein